MRKPCKLYTAVVKVAILRRHLVERAALSDLCDQYEIQPSMFRNWRKQFFESIVQWSQSCDSCRPKTV
jgi:transposase